MLESLGKYRPTQLMEEPNLCSKGETETLIGVLNNILRDIFYKCTTFTKQMFKEYKCVTFGFR